MNDVGAAKPTAPADARQVYARLVRYLKPHWKPFALAIFGTTVFAATNGGFLGFMQKFLNEAFSGDSPPRYLLWFVPVSIITLFFVRGVGD